MSYRVDIRRKALKDLESLEKKSRAAVINAIENLATNPRPPGCKKLKGVYPATYRVRVGDYRILYDVDDIVKIVGIQQIGHRGTVYN